MARLVTMAYKPVASYSETQHLACAAACLNEGHRCAQQVRQRVGVGSALTTFTAIADLACLACQCCIHTHTDTRTVTHTHTHTHMCTRHTHARTHAHFATGCATFEKTANAAIAGNNREQLTGQTPSTCSAECCKRIWCKSFDFHRGAGKCDLSDQNEASVGLKTDYWDNPYDHYARSSIDPKSASGNMYDA